MQITIHRGTKEIGGTVIELATANTTILLDLGLPLTSASREIDLAALKPDAVIVSHPHQDHYGLIDKLDSSVPVYIGKLAKELICAVRVFLNKPMPDNNFCYFQKWQKFSIGDFTITPYLVDHSAVDAYAFLIEAEGKKIFYSGDFRASGNKDFLFDKLLTDAPKDIDLLLMEGTMMRRDSSEFPDEASVRKSIEQVLNEQQNISFLISSSQNIDRLVSAAYACENAGKIFVIDIYTAWVLEKVKEISGKTPTMSWDQVKIYADYRPDQVLTASPDYFGDFRKKLYQHRVTKEELTSSPSRYLCLSKMSKARIMEQYKPFGPINLIYSQWLGYLNCSNQEYWGAEEIAAFREDKRAFNFIYAHTSGHATKDILKKMAHSLSPAQLVPIHTEHPSDYANEFNNVTMLADGESLVL